MQITVEQVMATCPAVAVECSTIDEAIDRLLAARASELYVVDTAGRLLGVVPDYELLKAQLGHSSRSEPIATLMSYNILTTEKDRSIAAIAPAFRESRWRKAAVVENGILIGQIDRRDVLAALRQATLPCTFGEPSRPISARCPAADSAPSLRAPRFLQNVCCVSEGDDESESP